MNREEAIAILKDEAYVLYEDDSPYNRQAFDMAVEALEEQRTGKWVRAYDCDCLQCNQCGTPSIVARPYCCICGAKMEVNHDNLY